jgi:hypothetical protein
MTQAGGGECLAQPDFTRVRAHDSVRPGIGALARHSLQTNSLQTKEQRRLTAIRRSQTQD